MRRSRPLAVVTSAALAFALVPSSASAASSFKNLGRIQNGTGTLARNGRSTTSHHHFLQQALTQLRSAEQSLASGNSTRTHQHVRTAITHIEQAIVLHNQNHGTQGNNALTGGLGSAHHSQHHSQLKEALASAQTDEKGGYRLQLWLADAGQRDSLLRLRLKEDSGHPRDRAELYLASVATLMTLAGDARRLDAGRVSALQVDESSIGEAALLLAEEGKLVRTTALVSDDVQVRNVEFYLDGALVATEGGFPFDYY